MADISVLLSDARARELALAVPATDLSICSTDTATSSAIVAASLAMHSGQPDERTNEGWLGVSQKDSAATAECARMQTKLHTNPPTSVKQASNSLPARPSCLSPLPMNHSNDEMEDANEELGLLLAPLFELERTTSTTTQPHTSNDVLGTCSYKESYCKRVYVDPMCDEPFGYGHDDAAQREHRAEVVSLELQSSFGKRLLPHLKVRRWQADVPVSPVAHRLATATTGTAPSPETKNIGIACIGALCYSAAPPDGGGGGGEGDSGQELKSSFGKRLLPNFKKQCDLNRRKSMGKYSPEKM